MIAYPARVKYMGLSGLAGWAAGFAAALPAESLIGFRDTGGEPRLFAATMALGLMVWGVWTLLLALAAWLILAVPCALVLQPLWLLRHKPQVLCATALVALAFTFARLYSFRDTSASRLPLRFILYMPYGCFAVAFSVMTAWLYLRLVQRALVSRAVH